jgi:hypothetical protein
MLQLSFPQVMCSDRLSDRNDSEQMRALRIGVTLNLASSVHTVTIAPERVRVTILGSHWIPLSALTAATQTETKHLLRRCKSLPIHQSPIILSSDSSLQTHQSYCHQTQQSTDTPVYRHTNHTVIRTQQSTVKHTNHTVIRHNSLQIHQSYRHSTTSYSHTNHTCGTRTPGDIQIRPWG